MEVFEKIKDILTDILDIEGDEISSETYVMRELGAESIDLLELAVSLNSAFQIEINDDKIFLKKLRLYINELKNSKEDPVSFISSKFPFLDKKRINEMLDDLDKGPVLKVKDLISYIKQGLRDRHGNEKNDQF